MQRVLAEQAKRQSRIYGSEQQAGLRKHFTSIDFEDGFPEALHLLTTLESCGDNHLRSAKMLGTSAHIRTRERNLLRFTGPGCLRRMDSW